MPQTIQLTAVFSEVYPNFDNSEPRVEAVSGDTAQRVSIWISYNYNRPHTALGGQLAYERFREKMKLAV